MSVNILGGLVFTGRSKISSGGGTPSGIQVTFSEFNPSGLSGGQDIEDPTGTFNPPIGFTINGTATGVAMANLTTQTDALFAANPNKTGYVWNVTWASGSTYTTTPVAMYYGLFGGQGIVFWILDPNDLNAAVPTPATFNYPAYFTSTTTPTSFQN